MKSIFNKSVWFILIFVFIALMSCDETTLVDPIENVSNTNFVAKETFSHKLDVANQSALVLEGINGNVMITGRAGFHSVMVKGEKRVESESTQDAADHLQLLEVNVRDLSNEITVKTMQPDESFGRNYVVDYEITLPITFAVIASNVNGAVSIDTLNNYVAITSINGQITLEAIFASTFIDLSNGQIEGDVTLPANGTIDMTVVNGGIKLDIPQNTSAELTAKVTNGGISIFDLELQNQTTTLTSVTGTLADGRGTISLKTVNGFIQVSGF